MGRKPDKKTNRITERCRIILSAENTQAKINKVLAINAATPNGVIRDADTILADIIKNADFEITGIFEAIAKVWLASSDKKGIEDIFYTFTDIPFETYLDMCIQKITT